MLSTFLLAGLTGLSFGLLAVFFWRDGIKALAIFFVMLLVILLLWLCGL